MENKVKLAYKAIYYK